MLTKIIIIKFLPNFYSLNKNVLLEFFLIWKMILKVIGHIANRPPYCTQHRESTQITVQLWLIANRPTLLYKVYSLGLLQIGPSFLLYTNYSLGLSQIGLPNCTQCTVQLGLIANRPTLLYTMYSLDLSQIGPPYCTQCTAWVYRKSAQPTVLLFAMSGLEKLQRGLITNFPVYIYFTF